MKKSSFSLPALVVGFLFCLSLGCGSSNSPAAPSSSSGSVSGGSVTPLAVTGVSPTTIIAGVPTTLTVTGSGFSASSIVQVNGTSLTTNFVSSTQLTALVAAGQLPATTSLRISVVDRGLTAGSTSAAIEVDNPKPAISSLSPANVVVGAAATTLTVAGSNFLDGTVLKINGTARTTSYASGSELTVTLTPQDLSATGSLSIVAVNPSPGGGDSNSVALSIINPAPVLSAVSPPTIYKSSSSTKLTLSGTGFQPTSTVLFNGRSLATAFIDSTRLSVTLAQGDLPQATSGTLQVATPGPGGGTSATLPLAISSTNLPAITSVTSSVWSTNTDCEEVVLTITGTDLAVPGPLVKINGGTIQPQYYTVTSSSVRVGLPKGFVAGSNPQITIESQVMPGLKSAPFTITSSAAAICIQPYTPIVYAGTSFALDTFASSINPTTAPVISGLTLPAGFSAASAAPYLPPARIMLAVDANTAAGNYSITPQLQGAPAMTVPLPVIVSSTKPSLNFTSPLNRELALPMGSSVSFSTQLMTSFSGSGITDFLVDVAVQGLPPGVTASIKPSPTVVGDSITITLTADSTAVPVQNLPITVAASASSLSLNATSPYLLSVYHGPGTIPNNRTTFTPTRATPSAVVFDRAHNLVFASNPVWNRIDVISNQTHRIERSIPVPSPAGIDLSQDNQTLWIATKSRQVYALDTAAFTMRRYTLSSSAGAQWASGQIFALANGDIFLVTDWGRGGNSALVWTPSTGAINMISTFADSVIRSGDGTEIFGLVRDYTAGCNVKVYSASLGLQTYILDSGSTGSSYCGTLQASNRDGSMLVGDFAGSSVKGVQIISGTAQVLGSFSPALTQGYLSTQETVYFNPTSFHFSDDGTLLYQTGVLPNYRSLLATYDVASRTLLGLAPAITSSVPPLSSGYGGPTVLADVDPTGMLIGIQSFGVAFEDSTYFQNVGVTSSALSAGPPSSFAPQSGPLSGDTSFPINAYGAILPDVWFGDIRGTVSASVGSLSLTSPAGSEPGPVDLKLIYPNGMLGYTAEGFSYGPTVQNMVYSGASPSGGARASITGFGLPIDSSGGTVTVGGSTAEITSVVAQYPPWTGESAPSTFLKFTVPAGTPGYADLQVQTPNGSSTLPRAMFYASSVNSYAFDGTATAVVYDKFRNRAYVVTKTKILVFDGRAGTFLSSITPPTANNVLDFYDAAISVDGNSLIVTNHDDVSVAVVDLTTNSSYVISTPYLAEPVNATCGIGPGPVAALAGNKALVLPVITNNNCYSASYAASMDLQSHTATPLTLGIVGWYVHRTQLQSNADGSLALITLTDGEASSYSTASGFGAVSNPIGRVSDAISGDGNIMSGDLSFADSTGRVLGTVAQPPALYLSPLMESYPPVAGMAWLRGARFNAAGSLYFVPHAGYFEVIDTLSASLKMRFSLMQTVQDIPRPIAIDQGGRMIFLVTNEGLTVVDMGQAPLSIGHLGGTPPASGGTIQIRGSGFDATTTALVDSTPATPSFVDENTLNLSLPALGSGAHDFTLQRNDGSSTTAKTLIVIP